jgi:predicted ArsR family transcriptional regulator
MTQRVPDSGSLQPHDSDRGNVAAVAAVAAVRAIAALEEPNRRRLYEMVAGAHDDVSRDQAADRLGMSRELAAFHLDRLVEAGLLEVGYRRLSGRTGPGAGRPAKLYRRARRDLAVSYPPRHYDVLADLFAEGLTELEREVGAETVGRALAAPARARGRAVGEAAAVTARDRDTGTAHERLVASLRTVLAGAGYEPTTDETGALALCNCPYRAVAEEHRDLTCGTNFAWAQGVVDGLGDPALAAEFVPGTERCCVRFSEA